MTGWRKIILALSLVCAFAGASSDESAKKKRVPNMAKAVPPLCTSNFQALVLQVGIKQPLDHLVLPTIGFTKMEFEESDLDSVFFTSDQHFGHDRIIPMANRPFRSVQEMDEMMILKWNETVPLHGVVFVVGDFSMNLDKTKKTLARLHGMKILVAGNHDLPHPENQKVRSQVDYERYRNDYIAAGFSDVVLGVDVKFPGVPEFHVSHYPYLERDELKTTPSTSEIPYRLVDDGNVLVCGHVHCNWKTKGNMINVGVDVSDFKPVTATDLRDRIRKLAKDDTKSGEPRETERHP